MYRHSSEIIQSNPKQYMLKVNQIINSIYAMNHSTLQSQLQTCHHIVGQVLHNDLIAHLQSISAVKLFSYQLILMLAEEQSIQNKPKIKQMQEYFQNNKKIKLTTSLKHVLSSIKSILQEIIWKNSKKKLGGQSFLGKNSKFYQYFLQFGSLLDQYDRQVQDAQIQAHSFKSDILEDDTGNQALIQQLEQMISKKQKRIKQLTEELQENILDQKSLEDLIDELQSRNGQLSEEIEKLKQRVRQDDRQVILLQQKIEQLQKNNLILDKELQKRKQSSRTIPGQDEGNYVIKKNINLVNLGQKKKQYQQVCAQKQTQKNIQLQQYRRALLIQSISIQAMI